MIELEQDVEKLESVIEAISANPNNWIVSDIQKEGVEGVTKVELKPLDVSPYCTDVFGKCKQTLMMSATILDAKKKIQPNKSWKWCYIDKEYIR